MWKAAGLEEPHGCWEQQEEGGGSIWRRGEAMRTRMAHARLIEGEDAMDNLRAHPEWQL